MRHIASISFPWCLWRRPCMSAHFRYFLRVRPDAGKLTPLPRRLVKPFDQHAALQPLVDNVLGLVNRFAKLLYQNAASPAGISAAAACCRVLLTLSWAGVYGFDQAMASAIDISPKALGGAHLRSAWTESPVVRSTDSRTHPFRLGRRWRQVPLGVVEAEVPETIFRVDVQLFGFRRGHDRDGRAERALPMMADAPRKASGSPPTAPLRKWWERSTAACRRSAMPFRWRNRRSWRYCRFRADCGYPRSDPRTAHQHFGAPFPTPARRPAVGEAGRC